MEIKVLIVDQERTFAEALAARLDGEEDIKVVGAVQGSGVFRECPFLS